MGVSGQPQPLNELCIECGEFVDSLNSITGWCNSCSAELGYIERVAPSCISCGEPTTRGKLCSHCSYVQWLSRNADTIERVMAIEGIRIRQAIKIVRIGNRPICQGCGKPIKGGQRDRHYFCTKNPECLKGHNVYAYHLRNKPQSEALDLAITASRIFKLTADISNKSL